MTQRPTPAQGDFPHHPRDRAAPFFAFLAVAVVMAVGVLAFLAFQEGRPRRVEQLAENFAPAPALPPQTDPQPLPAPIPIAPR